MYGTSGKELGKFGDSEIGKLMGGQKNSYYGNARFEDPRRRHEKTDTWQLYVTVNIAVQGGEGIKKIHFKTGFFSYRRITFDNMLFSTEKGERK